MRNLLNQHIKNSDVTTMRTAGKETSIQNIITIFNFLVFLFSPLTCFYLCLFVMTVFSSFLNSTNRKILGLLVVVSGSVSIASRQVGAFQFDDMLRYYETFSKIFNGDFGAIFSYGGGLEVLPMLYYLLIAKLLGNIQVSSLVFWESLLTSLIFWFWLEKYGMEDVGKKNRSLCIASTLLFFSFINATQLYRQMLSSAILLHAIFSDSPKKRVVLFVLATLSHVTALPIFFLTRGLLYNSKKTIIYLTVILIIGIFYWKNIMTFTLQSLPISRVSEVISSYFGSTQRPIVAQLGSIKILVASLAAHFLVPSQIRTNKVWIIYILVNIILFLVFLQYPFVAERISLLPISLIPGYILFKSTKKYPILYSIVLSIYILYQFVIRGPMYSPVETGFQLWYYYPWTSANPFYFWS